MGASKSTPANLGLDAGQHIDPLNFVRDNNNYNYDRTPTQYYLLLTTTDDLLHSTP